MVRSFAEKEVDPQAEAHDRDERFNLELFRKLGELGLLGITVSEQYGGAGLDSTAAVIAHEELSAADPGFALAYLAHSMLFANNLQVNGNDAQRQKYLPGACAGDIVCGMGMSESVAALIECTLQLKRTSNFRGPMRVALRESSGSGVTVRCGTPSTRWMRYSRVGMSRLASQVASE